MPQGKGTYGKKVGRPKAAVKKLTKQYKARVSVANDEYARAKDFKKARPSKTAKKK